MVSCAVQPHESEAKCYTDTRRESNPLFELNRTAVSVVSGNNGMPTFSTPYTHTHTKKIMQNVGGRKK